MMTYELIELLENKDIEFVINDIYDDDVDIIYYDSTNELIIKNK